MSTTSSNNPKMTTMPITPISFLQKVIDEKNQEIERLREDCERLRYEMECIADVSECRLNSLLSQINEIARDALKEGE
jgi:F0F1-type ATP synthase membrane subunit b/b'